MSIHDPLLQQALQHGNPLIEGEIVRLVWQGEEPPTLVGDFNDWGRGKRIEPEERAPNVWVYTLSLPMEARIEYNFVRGAERVSDPLNQQTTPSGLGHDQYVIAMPDYAPNDPAGGHQMAGALTEHALKTEGLLIGERRVVHLYQPPDAGRVPLVVVFDGQDYIERVRLPTLVDALIGQGRMQPVALALVESHPTARMVEYAASESTLAFLLNSLLPFADEQIDLLKRPSVHGVMGASMGGLMALHAGMRAPLVFGRVLSQSGAFSIREHDMVVWDLVEHTPLRPLRVWMDVGTYDIYDLLTVNREMRDLLTRRGYDVTFREYPAGHNYPAWRDEVGRGLVHLYTRRATS